MKRQEIINQLKPYFKTHELVCPHVLQRWGEQSWRFLSTEFLHTLLIIRRDILKVAMTCNNYHARGSFSQRGLRCNLCQIVSDYSKQGKLTTMPHVLGEGGDFSIFGMTAAEARKCISENARLLPYPIRMEDGVTWLHWDVLDCMNGQKITLFKP